MRRRLCAVAARAFDAGAQPFTGATGTAPVPGGAWAPAAALAALGTPPTPHPSLAIPQPGGALCAL